MEKIIYGTSDLCYVVNYSYDMKKKSATKDFNNIIVIKDLLIRIIDIIKDNGIII